MAPRGRVAVVTGGQGGLGRAVAAALEAAGFAVHAPGRDRLDVLSPRGVREFFRSLDRVDLLVNNAGLVRDGPVARLGEAEWDAVLDTNLKGAFLCAREAARHMIRRRTGHIVNIGSFSGIAGPAGQANYAAAKAGVLGLTRSLAAELGARNVRVNAVLPGFLETKLTRGVRAERKRAVLAAHVLGRFNTSADAARFIAFLDTLENVSGQVFQLDSRLPGAA